MVGWSVHCENTVSFVHYVQCIMKPFVSSLSRVGDGIDMNECDNSLDIAVCRRV